MLAPFVPLWFLCFPCPRLSLEQRLLPCEAPAVTARFAVTPHHPVAWDRQCERVRCARTSHRTRSRRAAEPFGNLRIRHDRACRYRLQCLPDALLKRRSLDVQGQVKAAVRSLEEGQYSRDPSTELSVALFKPRLREPSEQALLQNVGSVAKVDHTDPFLRRRDEQPAQITLGNREADQQSCRPVLVLRGRHTKHGG